MPRKPRILVPGLPVHVIQRGNNRAACFYADEDYQYYLDALSEAGRKFDCAVHAYVLMTNHVHLLITTQVETGISAFMQSLGRRYVRYINHTYRRTGTLWEGRFKSCLVQEEQYFFICSRYIEMNPVRAGMVNHPGDYTWSSYRCNALGVASLLVEPHPLYLGLGETRQARLDQYNTLFKAPLENTVLDTIRTATNKNRVLGNSMFKVQVGNSLQRQVDGYSHGGDRKSEKFKQGQRSYAYS